MSQETEKNKELLSLLNDDYDCYYNLFDENDMKLIEPSFTKAYGIRLRTLMGTPTEYGIVGSKMSWDEFLSHLAGLDDTTPIGKVVAIRSEKDPDIIAKFSPAARKIHDEWKMKKLQEKYKKVQAFKERGIEIDYDFSQISKIMTGK